MLEKTESVSPVPVTAKGPPFCAVKFATSIFEALAEVVNKGADPNAFAKMVLLVPWPNRLCPLLILIWAPDDPVIVASGSKVTFDFSPPPLRSTEDARAWLGPRPRVSTVPPEEGNAAIAAFSFASKVDPDSKLASITVEPFPIPVDDMLPVGVEHDGIPPLEI